MSESGDDLPALAHVVSGNVLEFPNLLEVLLELLGSAWTGLFLAHYRVVCREVGPEVVHGGEVGVTINGVLEIELAPCDLAHLGADECPVEIGFGIVRLPLY